MFNEKQGNVLHGILLIVLFSFSAFYIAEIQFIKNLSLSPLIVGIVLGMLYANSLRNRLPETWVPGIKFCSKQILRAGIVLYGFRLTLTDVAAVGLPAILVDSIIVCGTIFLGIFLGKLLKIDKDTALITSTGSAICGAAAVLGAEPVIKCEGHKTAIAVSTVVIFGTIAMFLYPIMYRSGLLSSLSDTQVAIYTGSTLHEVAHVAGAGNAMDPTDTLGIAGTATITKMIRVMLLAPVLVIRRHSGQEQDYHSLVRIRIHRHHLPEFPAPVPLRCPDRKRHSSERSHRIHRYLHADHGHDGTGRRDQHRQVQAGRSQALHFGLWTFHLAGGWRLPAGKMAGLILF